MSWKSLLEAPARRSLRLTCCLAACALEVTEKYFRTRAIASGIKIPCTRIRSLVNSQQREGENTDNYSLFPTVILKGQRRERRVGKKHGYNLSSDNFLFKQQQATSFQQFNPTPLFPLRLLTRLRCLLVACEPVMFQQGDLLPHWWCPVKIPTTPDPTPPTPQIPLQPPTTEPDNHRQTRETQRGREGGRSANTKLLHARTRRQIADIILSK